MPETYEYAHQSHVSKQIQNGTHIHAVNNHGQNYIKINLHIIQ